MDGDQLYGTFAEITGRRFPHLVLPGMVVGPLTRVIDAVQRRLPARWHYPADPEAVEIARRDTRFDDSATRKEFDLEPTPLVTTIGDTINWLVESGRGAASLPAMTGNVRTTGTGGVAYAVPSGVGSDQLIF